MKPYGWWVIFKAIFGHPLEMLKDIRWAWRWGTGQPPQEEDDENGR